MWRWINLTLGGKIIICKTLALSKFVSLAQVLPIPNEIATAIQRIQREFLWKSNNVKVSKKLFAMIFKMEVSRMWTYSKICSLQCSWGYQNSNDWKLIPVRFIDHAFGKNFFFHSNLSFKSSVMHPFPTFYSNFLQSWKKNLSHISYTPSCIGSHYCLKIVLQSITILFTIKNFWVTILNLPIRFLHLRKNLKTGITSKEKFNSPIIYVYADFTRNS